MYFFFSDQQVHDRLLIDFQDGSYSRGPVHIPVGEVDDSNYYLSPTFKFEQVSITFHVTARKQLLSKMFTFVLVISKEANCFFFFF